MKKNILNKQKVPLILSVVMFLVLVGVVIYLIIDLGLSIDESLKTSVKPGGRDVNKVKFDIEAFKKLNLDK